MALTQNPCRRQVFPIKINNLLTGSTTAVDADCNDIGPYWRKRFQVLFL